MAKKLMPLLAGILLLASVPRALRDWHWFEPAARRNQKGIDAFQRGAYAAALEQFLSAQGLKPGAPPLKNNTAAALYQLKKYQEALAELSSIDESKLGAARATWHYNLGNVQYRLGRYPQALESYKRSLKLAPDDIQAKKNFELTLKKMQEQQRQPQQNPQPDPQAKAEPQKHEAMMQFLTQNEKQQMEKKKRKAAPSRNEKDW